MKFVGTRKAKEISLTQTPANPLAQVLVTKNNPTDQPSETDDMDVKLLQRVATMSDVTKSHFAGLADEAAKAFLAKPTADQDAEAAAAAAEIAKSEAEAKAKADADISKRAESDEVVKSLLGQVKDLTEVIKGLQSDKTLDAQAADPAFAGYPGGTEAVKALLKTTDGLTADSAKLIIDGAKALAALNSRVGRTQFSELSEEELARSAPESSKVKAEARKRSEANGTSIPQEMAKMASEPAWEDAVEKAIAEANAG